MEPYYYSVVKFVPHPIREEALNIGIVLVSAFSEYTDFRFNTAVRSKLRVLAPDVHYMAVGQFIEDFQARFPRVGSIESLLSPHDRIAASIESLQEFTRHHSTQIKFTPTRPLLTRDPEETLKRLFKEFVAPIRLSRKRVVGRLTIRRCWCSGSAVWG